MHLQAAPARAILCRMWENLNQIADPEDLSISDARRSILARLGDYAALVIGPLNLRPRTATLHTSTNDRIEVRVSTVSSHILLVIAPVGDLAAEAYWLRALAAANLPIPRLLAHDLGCTLVPFSYTIESYTSGAPLDWVADAPRIRVLARQLGRTLRRAHQSTAAGFGRPLVNGRWPARSWADALHTWLGYCALWPRAEALLGKEGMAALRSATLEHPALECDCPRILHGAVTPDRVLVTVGDTSQVEALTRPGELVGGDPMFDLAYALQPHHPAAFRQGVREGYCAMGPLTPEHEARLARLTLLLHTTNTLTHGDEHALIALPDAVAAQLRAL